MKLSDIKREILLHADIIAPGEILTQEQDNMTLHQTVARALSCRNDVPPSFWLAGQIAYCLARYAEELERQKERIVVAVTALS